MKAIYVLLILLSSLAFSCAEHVCAAGETNKVAVRCNDGFTVYGADPSSPNACGSVGHGFVSWWICQ